MRTLPRHNLRWRTYPILIGLVLWSTWLLDVWAVGISSRAAIIAAAALGAGYVAALRWLWHRAGPLRRYPIETAAAALSSPALYAAMARVIRPTPLVMAAASTLSLRGLAAVLVVSHDAALVFYAATSFVVVAVAAWIWRTVERHEVRVSSAILAAVLIDPVVREGDLLVLTPIFLLLASWILEAPDDPARRLVGASLCVLYFAPVLAPIADPFRVTLIVGALLATFSTLALDALESAASQDDKNASSGTDLTLAGRSGIAKV